MKAKATTLVVDEGRVRCPNRGDVEIDRCYDCPAFEGLIRTPSGRDTLMCRPDVRSWTWWRDSE